MTELTQLSLILLNCYYLGQHKTDSKTPSLETMCRLDELRLKKIRRMSHLQMLCSLRVIVLGGGGVRNIPNTHVCSHIHDVYLYNRTEGRIFRLVVLQKLYHRYQPFRSLKRCRNQTVIHLIIYLVENLYLTNLFVALCLPS